MSMSKFDRQAFLKEAEAAVLRGLAKGYASGAKATPVPSKPGWKCYEYSEGLWYLRDAYYVHPVTGKSVGETRMHYCEHHLIWFMSYGGFYKKEAISCLKGALMANYQRGIFNAGRGKDGYQESGYRYGTLSYYTNSFERFFAHESVYSSKTQSGGGTIIGSDGAHEVWAWRLSEHGPLQPAAVFHVEMPVPHD